MSCVIFVCFFVVTRVAKFIFAACHYLGNKYDCISIGGLMGSMTPVTKHTIQNMQFHDRFFAGLAKKYPSLIYQTSFKLLRYLVVKRPKMVCKYLDKTLSKQDVELLSQYQNERREVIMEIIAQSLTNTVDGICSECQFEAAFDRKFKTEDIKKDIKMFIFHGKTDQLIPMNLIKNLEKELNNYESQYFDHGHFFPMNTDYVKIMYETFAQYVPLNNNDYNRTH